MNNTARKVKLNAQVVEQLEDNRGLLLVKGGTSPEMDGRDINIFNCGCVKNRRKACKPQQEEIKQEQSQ